MNPNEFNQTKEMLQTAKEMMHTQWEITDETITGYGFNSERIHSLCRALVNTINKRGIPVDPETEVKPEVPVEQDQTEQSADEEGKTNEEIIKEKMSDFEKKKNIVLIMLKTRLHSPEYASINDAIILQNESDENDNQDESVADTEEHIENILSAFDSMLDYIDTETTYQDLERQVNDETKKMVNYLNSNEHYVKKQELVAEQKERLKEQEAVQGHERNMKEIKRLRNFIAVSEGQFNLSFINDSRVTTKNTVEVYFDPKKSSYVVQKYYDKCNQIHLNADVFKYFMNIEEKYLEERYHPFNNLFLFRCMRYIGTLDVTDSEQQFRTIVGTLTKIVYDRFPNEDTKETALNAIRSYLDRFIEDGYTEEFMEKNISYPKHPERIKKDMERETSARLYYYQILQQYDHGKTDQELSAMSISELMSFTKGIVDAAANENDISDDDKKMADTIINDESSVAHMYEAAEAEDDAPAVEVAEAEEVPADEA